MRDKFPRSVTAPLFYHTRVPDLLIVWITILKKEHHGCVNLLYFLAHPALIRLPRDISIRHSRYKYKPSNNRPDPPSLTIHYYYIKTTTRINTTPSNRQTLRRMKYEHIITDKKNNPNKRFTLAYTIRSSNTIAYSYFNALLTINNM